MFVVWALARTEWHLSCTISHRFDTWKGPWQDGRGWVQIAFATIRVPSFRWFQDVLSNFLWCFSLVHGITSIVAQHFGKTRMVLLVSMNNKAGYMLPFLGAVGTFELYDSWMAKVFFILLPLRTSCPPKKSLYYAFLQLYLTKVEPTLSNSITYPFGALDQTGALNQR